MKPGKVLEDATPRSSETQYKDPRDQRCAPNKQFQEGSCLTLNGLIKMANAYNLDNDDDKNKCIQLYDGFEMVNPKKYKRYLLKEFKKKFSKCKDQRCWLKQSYVQYMNEEDFDIIGKNSFRPDGPNGQFEWLNTIHIEDSMKQYELAFKDFKFMGANPMDFDDLPALGLKDLDYGQLKNEGKTKLGFIFNLDEHYKSGSHWVSMFADIAKGNIYYFDSVGIVPDPRIRKLIRRICRYCQLAGIKKPNIGYNKVRHQYGGSECGVYSINFIERMLDGDNFNDICNNKVSDKEINKYRKKYYNNTIF